MHRLYDFWHIYRPWPVEIQALLPVIREMGTVKGHARQSSLETRLALIAAAPWKGNLILALTWRYSQNSMTSMYLPFRDAPSPPERVYMLHDLNSR